MAEYIQLMLSQPGMQAWASQALEEPWGDPGHEADGVQIGDGIEDFRRLKPE